MADWLIISGECTIFLDPQESVSTSLPLLMGWMPVPPSWPSSMHVCPLAIPPPLQHYDQGTRCTTPSTGKVGVAYYMYIHLWWVWLITCTPGWVWLIIYTSWWWVWLITCTPRGGYSSLHVPLGVGVAHYMYTWVGVAYYIYLLVVGVAYYMYT